MSMWRCWMIVITLTKVPASLRGDLTKWCQEIQTGVYVGNVSARVRERLWERIKRNIGNGEATMAYNINNELGYDFKTTRKDRQVIDFDGIPLMKKLNSNPTPVNHGFSNAAKYHRARVMMQKRPPAKTVSTKEMDFVVLDVETSGLDYQHDKLISVGAVKQDANGEIQTFYEIVKATVELSAEIQKLTGLTNEILIREGKPISEVMTELRKFIGNKKIVGYNLNFDLDFVKKEMDYVKLDLSVSQSLDILPLIKKRDRFLDNYRLNTVLAKYGIKNDQPHNSLADAMATWQLLTKLIKKGWV